MGGYTKATWIALLAIVIGPQIMGHSMINFALHRVSATTVSVLSLLGIPGAAVLGWLWLGQVPRAASLPGLVLGVIGVAIVLVGAARSGDQLDPAVDGGSPGEPTVGGHQGQIAELGERDVPSVVCAQARSQLPHARQESVDWNGVDA